MSQWYITKEEISFTRKYHPRHSETLNIHAGMILDWNKQTNILRVRNRGNTDLIHIFSRSGENIPMTQKFNERINKLLLERKIIKFDRQN